MAIEHDIALLPVVLEELRGLRRDVAALRAERQHAGGHWATRAEAAKHLALSVDTIDRMIRDGELRAQRIGEEPEGRRDVRGRRIDRRPVRIWLTGAPRTEVEIDAMAQEARARA